MTSSTSLDDTLDLPETLSTEEVGRVLGRTAPAGGLILLSGPTGAGKTSLAKGVAQGLGIPATIVSPTFLYLQGYECKKDGARLDLLHADWDRVSGFPEDLEETLFEGLENRVTIVEWGEKISGSLRESFPMVLHITIAFHADGRRLSMSWIAQTGGGASAWRDSFFSGMAGFSGSRPDAGIRQPAPAPFS